MRKFDRHRRPSLWLAIPIVMVLTLVWTNTEYPVDYWLHINNGQWMVDTGELIHQDTFTHTIAGQPVQNQPWLAQLVMHRLHLIGGYQLNQFVAGLAYAFGIAAMMWLVACRCGNWTLAALGGCLAVALMATNLGVRPQYFSVILFSVQLVLLWRVRSTWALSAGCFLVMSLWTNMHGAFPLGAVVPGILLAARLTGVLFNSTDIDRETAKRLAFATAASAVGCFVRPFPGDAIGYVTNCSSRAVERGLVEWLPTSLSTESGTMFFISVILLNVILCLSRRRADLASLLLLGAFFVLAISSQRMVLWWAFVMPLAIARPADELWRHAKRRLRSGSQATATPNTAGGMAVAKKPTKRRQSPLDRIMGTVMGVIVIGFVVFCTPWSRRANACLPPMKRVAIPNGEPHELMSEITRRILNDRTSTWRTFAPLSWGSYLTWYSDGRLKSFIDTRVDFFPDEIWSSYQQIAHGEANALELLDHYGVEIVVCDIHQEHLIRALSQSPAWGVQCSDEVGVVFAHVLDARVPVDAKGSLASQGA